MSNRGSEWGRWDLHVHTKGTAKNDQFGDITFQKYCNELFKKALEKEIRVIGITDYFSLDNFEKVLDFQKNIHNSSFDAHEQEQISRICLLPNLELRISPTTGKNTFVNIHLIFNPSLIDDFKNEILSEIKISIDGNESYNLTKQGLSKLGRKFDEKALDDETAYRVGLRKAAVEHGQIIKALHNNKTFNNECLVFVANGSNDGVSGVNSHEGELNVLTTAIYTLADGIFSAKPSDIKFFSTKSGNSSYDNVKPCVHGCDAHNLEKLFEPDFQRYCWIKAEPSFEGLKQIIHEIDRVKIDAIRPEPKNSYEVIDKIVINDENVLNEEIYLNPNLNTIIGGRSSGKSTLIQAIAYKLNPSSMREGEADRHIKSLAQNIKIIWKDGKEDYLRQVEYFYQGHMYAKSNEKGIESIVEEIQRSIHLDKYAVHKEKVDGYLQENSTNVSKYLSQKQSMTQIISQINAIGKVEDIKEEIQSIEHEIFELNLSNVDSAQLQLHEQAKSEIIHLKNEKIQASHILTKVDNLSLKDFVTIENPFETDLVSDEIQNLIGIDSFLSTLSNELNDKVNQFLFDKRDKLNLLINSIDSEIAQKQSNSEYIRREDLYQANQRFKPLQERKNLESNKLTLIESYLSQLKLLESESEKLYDNIKKNLINMEQVLNELVIDLNSFPNERIKIINKSVFQEEKFSKFIAKNIDQRSEKAQQISQLEFSNTEQIIEKFSEILDCVNNDQLKLKSGVSLGNLLNEFFTTTWFEIGYDVIYDGDNYNEMSQGKKAFVVLKLTLDCSNKKCPILIDQPEDDLDNRAIFTELVKYLKDKKADRQIILVTHNANVVINADSEQIIVANQNGTHSPNKNNKKFAYKTGSIESMQKVEKSTNVLDSKTIREHACEILEGGNRAFELREKKYNS